MSIKAERLTDSVTLYGGDCLSVLKVMPSDSVHCCVTSPPYWGLRDYGTAIWSGGDETCSHKPSDTPSQRGIASSTLGGGKNHTGHRQEGFKKQCSRCGAARIDSQLGLEPTPEAYVANMVAVFREVRRVLRDDGTLWLNLGDSYAANRSYQVTPTKWKALPQTQGGSKVPDGLKPKDLLGIPWRVAFALQADGWWLRSDIIWHKPNPMPESVTDRCTKAHEYIFLLAKSERYYYDSEAVAEPVASSTIDRLSQPTLRQQIGSNRVPGKTNGNMKAVGGTDTRNRRSVWTVNTKPYKGAHFATMPPALVEPCILAGCPEGGTVIDPFNGSGTTGEIAIKHGRNYIGIELNPQYIELTRQRLLKADGTAPGTLFANVAPVPDLFAGVQS